MATSDASIEAPNMTEDFAALLDEQLGSEDDGFEGRVLKGTVISVDSDVVVVDVGLKSEGRVPTKEFGNPGQPLDIKPGDEVDVFVERYEDRDGIILSLIHI